MTFHLKLRNLLIAAVALLSLNACNGDGSSTPGIRVMAQTTYLQSDAASGEPDAETDPAHEASAIKPIYRDDNMYIDLQLGLVNLRVVELLPCSSIVAKAASGLLNFVFPAAHAHSAHIPSGPAGVIDVLKPDLLVWDLGEQGTKAGEYCGVKLEIAPVAGEASHDDGGAHHASANAESEGNEEAAEEEGINMAGKAVLVSPCYYPDTAGSPRTPLDSQTSHSCIEAAYTGTAMTGTVLFEEPLTLNANKRSAHIMLATYYDSWFDGLDMTSLAEDHDEQHALVMNILDSFYAYSVK